MKREKADDYLSSMRRVAKVPQRRHRQQSKGQKGLSSGMLSIAANQYARDASQTQQLEELIRASSDMDNMLSYTQILQQRGSKNRSLELTNFDFSVSYQDKMMATSPVGKRCQVYDRICRRIL